MAKRWIITCFLLAVTTVAGAKHQKPERIEGEYHITIAGQEIGVEKFAVITTEAAISSASIVQFRSPAGSKQKVTMETKLEMDTRFRPRSYELKSEVDGKKGTIQSSFRPNEAIFAYSGGGSSSRSGLLVGENYTILDTNAFHHFIFLARLFDFGSSEKVQQFEVVIPQEKETGIIKISVVGSEEITIKDKTIRATHLKIETSLATLQMWVDDDHVPCRISLPEKGVEVIKG